MRIGDFSFGSIQIDGGTYEHDVIIDRERSRNGRQPSRKYRGKFGHTPLSTEEKIPWKCHQLIIGNGFNRALPVMDDVKRKANIAGLDSVTI
jgi:hypothetical protein